jgi:hypothetical protein
MESVGPILISTLMGALPLIVVCTTGIVVSIVRWNQHPRLSLLTWLGLGLMLLSRIVLGTLGMWLPLYMREQGWEMQRMGLMTGALALLGNTLSAVGLSVLVYAIFTAREKMPGGRL